MIRNCIIIALLASVFAVVFVGCEQQEDFPAPAGETEILYQFRGEGKWDPLNDKVIEIAGEDSEFDITLRTKYGLSEFAVISVISDNKKCSVEIVDKLEDRTNPEPDYVVITGQSSYPYYNQRVHVDMDTEKSIAVEIKRYKDNCIPCTFTIQRK